MKHKLSTGFINYYRLLATGRFLKKKTQMDIKEIKSTEVSEMYDFLEGLQDYGHIYHYPPEKLDQPFKKIMEGIEEIQQLMKDSFEM